MKTIHKFVLYPGEVCIRTHEGAEILHIAAQRNHPVVWLLVDPTKAPEERTFAGYTTGAMVGPRRNYIGTVLLDGGDFVLHFFEVCAP